MTTWYPPTYASAFRIPRARVVKCPNCRRKVPASMLYDLRAIPTSRRTRIRDATGFACDACRDILFRERRLTRADYAIAHDAPAEVVRRAEEIDALLGA